MIDTWLQVIALVLQAAFWGTIGTIAVLTYRSAKRSILQPIRTEVFKSQIQELSEVLSLLVGRSEMDLRYDCATETALEANAVEMFDTYVKYAFGIEIETRGRPYSVDKCGASLFSKEYAERNLTLVDEHISSEIGPASEEMVWADYEHGEIHIPNQHTEYVKQFGKILESPLTPKPVSDSIVEYLRACRNNIALVGEVLTECAREMENKYPSREVMERASFSWLRNKYNDRIIHLKPKSDDVILKVRAHFQTDDLLDMS
jgi:hypothetical protein